MTKKITSTMVAKAAGVAQSTVSLVINNSPRVAVETQKAVLEAARELGYSLIPQNKRRFIGIILSRNIQCVSYQYMCLEAIKHAISKRGYRMELVCSEDIPILNERAICGAIAISGKSTINRDWSMQKNIPLVRIANCSDHRNNIFSVYNDVEYNLNLALDHLREYGHQRVALVRRCFRNHENGLMEKYGETFLRLQVKHGVENPESMVLYREKDISLREQLQELLDQSVTALIIEPGDAALEVGNELRQMGVKIPEQLSIIAREYPKVSEFWTPPLTSILPDYDKTSEIALDIIERFLNREKNISDIQVRGKLLKRESVAFLSC